MTRELLRVDMQWEGVAPGLYAGALTGGLLGIFTGWNSIIIIIIIATPSDAARE